MLTLIWHWITNWIIGWGGIGALVSAAAWALWFFWALWFLWALWFFCPAFLLTYKSQLLHIAVAATVFTFASIYFFTSGYNKGYSTAINQVAAQNRKATDAVNKVTSDVQACFDSGGTFDDVAGVCVK